MNGRRWSTVGHLGNALDPVLFVGRSLKRLLLLLLLLMGCRCLLLHLVLHNTIGGEVIGLTSSGQWVVILASAINAEITLEWLEKLVYHV